MHRTPRMVATRNRRESRLLRLTFPSSNRLSDIQSEYQFANEKLKGSRECFVNCCEKFRAQAFKSPRLEISVCISYSCSFVLFMISIAEHEILTSYSPYCNVISLCASLQNETISAALTSMLYPPPVPLGVKHLVENSMNGKNLVE